MIKNPINYKVMKTNYVKFGDLYFNEETKSYLLKETICSLYKNKNRVRVWYGDSKTGVSWNDENDVCGTIGRSTGEIKVPLLISSARSYGGGALLDSCIIKIVDTQTKRVLYQHPTFKQSLFVAEQKSDVPGYAAKVRCDSMVYANCKTMRQAENLAAFMNGERMRK